LQRVEGLDLPPKIVFRLFRRHVVSAVHLFASGLDVLQARTIGVRRLP
jgi:hypothetical protein